MNGKKVLLILIGLVLLLSVLVLVFRSRQGPAPVPSVTDVSRSIGAPAFNVYIDRPLLTDRPPWEIPGVVLGRKDRGPRLTQATPGARVGNVAPNHLELSADGGWNLLIEIDRDGRPTSATHVAFPITLGGRPIKFDCRAKDQPKGYLDATTRPGSGELDGSFMIELTICKNAVSGKTAAWPAQPLIVQGNFAGFPQGSR